MIETAKLLRTALTRAAIITALLGAICLSDAAQRSEPGGDDFYSNYKIITERNIFSRQRGRRAFEPSEGRDQPTRRVTRRSEESYIVLAGLAKVDNVFVAFFEDTRGGSLIRITAGGALARGKIAKLNLDSVVYELNGESASVMVGQTLEGELGALPIAETSYVTSSEIAPAGAAAPTSSDANAPASSADEADILKKLIERRKQELGE